MLPFTRNSTIIRWLCGKIPAFKRHISDRMSSSCWTQLASKLIALKFPRVSSSYRNALFSFLGRIGAIRRPDYLPTNEDLLRCRIITQGIYETKFEVNRVTF